MDAQVTTAEALAYLKLDSIDAAKHARCGPQARCRRNAIARCDEDLDAYLESLAVPDLRDVGTRAEHGS